MMAWTNSSSTLAAVMEYSFSLNGFGDGKETGESDRLSYPSSKVVEGEEDEAEEEEAEDTETDRCAGRLPRASLVLAVTRKIDHARRRVKANIWKWMSMA
ncbi:hypothetical protein N7493_008510 [Penicillium malachiteum]|uniref:Uncharacterized protein n=1 Tax=Penicillium malachiteum TaxID=1324776 RepID=A0AAD6HHE7_9EURO|nr:hypothetical protein N7493_008510 [Penicillium malachiteum]